MAKIKAEVLCKTHTNALCYRQVEGYYFNKYGFEGIIHRDIKKPNFWILTHLKSGLKVINKANKKSEIEDKLLERIKRVGEDTFYERLKVTPSLKEIKKEGELYGRVIISPDQYKTGNY